MPLNATAESFIPLGGVFSVPPTITETSGYNGLTTAALAALGTLTQVAVSSTVTTVQGQTKRNTMTLVVPLDQPAITVGNQNTIAGNIASPPQVIWAVPGSAQANPSIATFSPPVSGFTIPSGGSIQLAPYNDPLYAIVPSGTSQIFYVNT